VILVSPGFEVLLLHRVQTSSSFPSAHVFPGGNIDEQDGIIPGDGIERHQDNRAYRVGALRELFEESGILLARKQAGSRQLVSVPQAARGEGRRSVHSDKTPFQAWLRQQCPNAVLDTDNLIPFSHWITPSNIPRRFTTQMYIYLLPSEDSNDLPQTAEPTLTEADNLRTSSHQEDRDFNATSDGGLENTAATFHPAHTWLHLAQSGAIILFPPQFLLLHLISQFLENDQTSPRAQRRQRLEDIILSKQQDGSPPWSAKCISPYALAMSEPRADGKVVLALDKPGPEVENTGLKGDEERVVLVKWNKDGPRELEVKWRREVVEESKRRGGERTGAKP
jgi:8-oxo-dGTP pyrophosphatase MutT (NUDIX family)